MFLVKLCHSHEFAQHRLHNDTSGKLVVAQDLGEKGAERGVGFTADSQQNVTEAATRCQCLVPLGPAHDTPPAARHQQTPLGVQGIDELESASSTTSCHDRPQLPSHLGLDITLPIRCCQMCCLMTARVVRTRCGVVRRIAGLGFCQWTAHKIVCMFEDPDFSLDSELDEVDIAEMSTA